jgi:hypothetical protein
VRQAGAGAVSTKPCSDQLTTVQLHNLDVACQPIRKAFGAMPYLVGTAGVGGDQDFRDVDVRLMLGDEKFAEVCPTKERWAFLCLCISTYLSERTGLPVDFQIQQQAAANALHSGPRNPLGCGRDFAGGGDGTPPWDEVT